MTVTDNVHYGYSVPEVGLLERLLLKLQHGGQFDTHQPLGNLTVEDFNRINYQNQAFADAQAVALANMNEFRAVGDYLKARGINPQVIDGLTQSLHNNLIAPGGMLTSAYQAYIPENIRHALAGSRGSQSVAFQDYLMGLRGERDAYGEELLLNRNYARILGTGYGHMFQDDPTGPTFKQMKEYHALMRRNNEYGPKSMDQHLAEMNKDAQSALIGAVGFKDISGQLSQSRIGQDGRIISGQENFEQAAWRMKARAEERGQTFDTAGATRGMQQFTSLIDLYSRDIERLQASAERLRIESDKALADGNKLHADELFNRSAEYIKQAQTAAVAQNDEVKKLMNANKAFKETLEAEGYTAVFDTAVLQNGFSKVHARQQGVRSILAATGVDVNTLSAADIDNLVQTHAGGRASGMKNEQNQDRMTQMFMDYMKTMTYYTRGFESQDITRLASVIQETTAGTHLGKHAAGLSSLIAHQLKEVTYGDGRRDSNAWINKGAYWQAGQEEIANYQVERATRSADSGVANILGSAIALGRVSYAELQSGNIEDRVLRDLMAGRRMTQAEVEQQWVSSGLDRSLVRSQLQQRGYNLDLVNSDQYAISMNQRMSHSMDKNIQMGQTREDLQRYLTLMSPEGRDARDAVSKYLRAGGNDTSSIELVELLDAAEGMDSERYNKLARGLSPGLRSFLKNRGVDPEKGVQDAGLIRLRNILRTEAEYHNAGSVKEYLAYEMTMPLEKTEAQKKADTEMAAARKKAEKQLTGQANFIDRMNLTEKSTHDEYYKDRGFLGWATSYLTAPVIWAATPTEHMQADVMAAVRAQALQQGLRRGGPEAMERLEKAMHEYARSGKTDFAGFVAAANHGLAGFVDEARKNPNAILDKRTQSQQRDQQRAALAGRFGGRDLEMQTQQLEAQFKEEDALDREIKAGENPRLHISAKDIRKAGHWNWFSRTARTSAEGAWQTWLEKGGKDTAPEVRKKVKERIDLLRHEGAYDRKYYSDEINAVVEEETARLKADPKATTAARRAENEKAKQRNTTEGRFRFQHENQLEGLEALSKTGSLGDVKSTTWWSFRTYSAQANRNFRDRLRTNPAFYKLGKADQERVYAELDSRTTAGDYDEKELGDHLQKFISTIHEEKKSSIEGDIARDVKGARGLQAETDKESRHRLAEAAVKAENEKAAQFSFAPSGWWVGAGNTRGHGGWNLMTIERRKEWLKDQMRRQLKAAGRTQDQIDAEMKRLDPTVNTAADANLSVKETWTQINEQGREGLKEQQDTAYTDDVKAKEKELKRKDDEREYANEVQRKVKAGLDDRAKSDPEVAERLRFLNESLQRSRLTYRETSVKAVVADFIEERKKAGASQAELDAIEQKGRTIVLEKGATAETLFAELAAAAAPAGVKARETQDRHKNLDKTLDEELALDEKDTAALDKKLAGGGRLDERDRDEVVKLTMEKLRAQKTADGRPKYTEEELKDAELWARTTDIANIRDIKQLVAAVQHRAKGGLTGKMSEDRQVEAAKHEESLWSTDRGKVKAGGKFDATAVREETAAVLGFTVTDALGRRTGDVKMTRTEVEETRLNSALGFDTKDKKWDELGKEQQRARRDYFKEQREKIIADFQKNDGLTREQAEKAADEAFTGFDITKAREGGVGELDRDVMERVVKFREKRYGKTRKVADEEKRKQDTEKVRLTKETGKATDEITKQLAGDDKEKPRDWVAQVTSVLAEKGEAAAIEEYISMRGYDEDEAARVREHFKKEGVDLHQVFQGSDEQQDVARSMRAEDARRLAAERVEKSKMTAPGADRTTRLGRDGKPLGPQTATGGARTMDLLRARGRRAGTVEAENLETVSTPSGDPEGTAAPAQLVREPVGVAPISPRSSGVPAGALRAVAVSAEPADKKTGSAEKTVGTLVVKADTVNMDGNLVLNAPTAQFMQQA